MRQTTWKGTLRIGTMAQKVTRPARNRPPPCPAPSAAWRADRATASDTGSPKSAWPASAASAETALRMWATCSSSSSPASRNRSRRRRKQSAHSETGRARASLFPCGEERLGEGAESAQASAGGPFDLVVGQDPAEEPPTARGQGIAQEQSVQARAPGMLRGGRQIQCRAALAVHAPAHAGRADPIPDLLQVGLCNARSPTHRLDLQEAQHLVRPEAAFHDL